MKWAAGARFALLNRAMPDDDRSRAERIRGLIEEIDRVRRESERVSRQVERDLKRPFWPERRRSPRVPGSDEYDGDTRSR